MKPCKWLVVLILGWSSTIWAETPADQICDSRGDNCIKLFNDSVKHEQLQQVVSSNDSAQAPIVLASYRKRQYYNRRGYHHQHHSYNFSSRLNASGRRVFIFDPRNTAWAAYDSDGNLVRTGNASGGRHYCPDIHRRCLTPIGTFSVYSKGGPDCRSSKYPRPYGGAIMSHCMYFHGGYAIHSSDDIPNYNASHGCIRVQPAAAYWLNREFLEYGSTVIVRPY